MTEYNGVERSKTERLRAILDERGVDWDYGITGPATTMFNANGVDVTFTPMRDGLVCSTILTPEQAVEATLGRGTCKVVGHGLTACDDIEFHWYALSCGHRLRTLWAADTVGMYCPECGRRVEP